MNEDAATLPCEIIGKEPFES